MPEATRPKPLPVHLFFFLIFRRPPRPTLFPYTTLFRSEVLRRFQSGCVGIVAGEIADQGITGLLAAHAADHLQHALAGEIVESGRESGDAEINRSEEHTSELQSRQYLVCRLLLEKKKKI